MLVSFGSTAQETNSSVSGKVLSDNIEIPNGVSITIVHEPTQTKYVSVVRNNGYFNFFNLKPGGPYSIIFTSAEYDSLKETNLFIHLGSEYFLRENTEIQEFALQKKTVTLNEIFVDADMSKRNKTGLETIITASALQSMPTVSRSLQDFVRLVPQAKVNGDGVISLAGQNNRFNAFFIDGASNSDLKGLALNGMNGGQTGIPPVSMESIEEIKILLSPYNVQYGNFTGGSINAITRSGANENRSSIWYLFRNEILAGRSPQPIQNTGVPGELYRPRLTRFFNQTFGAWNSGAIVKSKLFYFLLIEGQSESRPQPFNFSEYRGNSSQQQLDALSEFISTTYGYDPGSYLETKDNLNAVRVTAKFDWNASLKDKFMLSYRYNFAERMMAPRPSSPNAVAFHNSGIIIPATSQTTSLEWKRFFNTEMNNRLLFTFTGLNDARNWIGYPFPGVTILDGNGTITFGSEFGTGNNKFNAIDLGLFDVFTILKKNHVVTIGADINYSTIDLNAIPSFFGAYQFSSLYEFMTMGAPSRLQKAFYHTERKSEQFRTLRTSSFINDELRLNNNFKVNFGLRLDVNSILFRPRQDQFFNDSAIRIISTYYDLDEVRSGNRMDPHWCLSPRFGFHYKLIKHNINFRGGAGIFLGKSINFWVFEVFNNSIGNIDIIPPQFYPDPYNQPTPESLNIDPSNLKGTLNLMAKKFKYPSVFRTSLAIEKQTKNRWAFSAEVILTKNIHEVAFRNVNILPPIMHSASPDSRNIYSLNSSPIKIPLRANGINPYAQVMLLTNNSGRKGYSYSATAIIQKQTDNLSFTGSYTYGRSNVLFEITGPQTPISSQWRNIETVNGRNFATISTSDNDLSHRITTWISKRINYAKKNIATTVSVFYNGQSGPPYSYVYANSMINDNGRRNENFDLIYIPTAADLIEMNFIPIKDINGHVLYSPEQQKKFLNAFIENDKYLKRHRGEFAKRNGARLPFTHLVDLRLQQEVIIKCSRKKIQAIITFDVFNFTNMLNRNWGRTWFLTNDSYPLITFEGFINTTTLTPQYQFRPLNGKPWAIQTSTLPGNSARWISQLGVKINIY